LKIIVDTETQYYQNPALNRGLHTFTSFISSDKDFLFLEAHIERLLKGAHWLYPDFHWNELGDVVLKFVKAQFIPNSYFRLMIFEDKLIFSKGLHLPKDQSVKVCKAFSKRTETLIPSFVKSSSYQNAEAELRAASQKGFGDVIFLDSEKNLCEATTANIFLVDQKNRIVTSPASSMVLSGVTRAMLIEFLKKNNYHIEERAIHEDELLDCTELWLSSSVSGLRVVNKFETRSLQNSFYDEVCKKFGRFGENYE
jgi:branched-subunit amino acid aminotransferase/4-amino-4-deoxychorismate lyase